MQQNVAEAEGRKKLETVEKVYGGRGREMISSMRAKLKNVLIGGIDRADTWRYCFYMATASQVQENLQTAMRDAFRIQDRFVAEPLFAKTGRGYLKREGVSTLQKIKSSLQRKSSAKSK